MLYTHLNHLYSLLLIYLQRNSKRKTAGPSRYIFGVIYKGVLFHPPPLHTLFNKTIINIAWPVHPVIQKHALRHDIGFFRKQI